MLPCAAYSGVEPPKKEDCGGLRSALGLPRSDWATYEEDLNGRVQSVSASRNRQSSETHTLSTHCAVPLGVAALAAASRLPPPLPVRLVGTVPLRSSRPSSLTASLSLAQRAMRPLAMLGSLLSCTRRVTVSELQDAAASAHRPLSAADLACSRARHEGEGAAADRCSICVVADHCGARAAGVVSARLARRKVGVHCAHVSVPSRGLNAMPAHLLLPRSRAT